MVQKCVHDYINKNIAHWDYGFYDSIRKDWKSMKYLQSMNNYAKYERILFKYKLYSYTYTAVQELQPVNNICQERLTLYKLYDRYISDNEK